MMRKEIVFALALGACLGGAVAFAQDNPGGGGAPAATPDGSAAASTAATSGDVIHLHLPVRHRLAHAPTKPAEPTVPEENPTVDSIGADATASPVIGAPVGTAAPPAPRAATPVKTAKSARPPAQKSVPAIPFTFGEDGGTAPPEGSGSQDNPSPQAAASTRQLKTASLPPSQRVPTAAPVKLAKAPVRAKSDEHAGLTKRGAVLFDKGMSNPSPQQFGGLKLLAGDVSTALESGASRVQLEAYGGVPGDKSSDSRRLSLKRALAVRQLLIDNGIPSNRIDVRAMGGTEDKGPNDRVDVYVRAS